MQEPEKQTRAQRIKEAIETSQVRMSRIADTVGVARTSVLNWTTRGGIQIDHLKELAAITGFNFWWLAFGEGPKLGNDTASLERAIQSMIHTSPEHADLIHRQAQLTQAGALSPEMASALLSLLEAMPKTAPTNTKD